MRGMGLNNPFGGYNQGREDRPLGAYGGLVALFHALFAVFLLAVKRTDRALPERLGLGDILLLGTATHKVSRLLAKDAVTSVLRAPFTTYQGPAGEGEINDAPRGRGMQHALGELLTCPFCLAQWVASFFAYGVVFAPRVTRLIAGIFAMVTWADFVQYGYDVTKQKTEQLEQERAQR
jgi:Protein of unknown function (DUF1360)